MPGWPMPRSAGWWMRRGGGAYGGACGLVGRLDCSAIGACIARTETGGSWRGDVTTTMCFGSGGWATAATASDLVKAAACLDELTFPQRAAADFGCGLGLAALGVAKEPVGRLAPSS